jgi:DNA-binding transcriptional regulator YiaG
MVMLDKQQIIDLRAAMGLTAREFGERLGVSWNTVFRWEQGTRYPSRRHQVALNKLKLDAEKKGLLQVA